MILIAKSQGHTPAFKVEESPWRFPGYLFLLGSLLLIALFFFASTFNFQKNQIMGGIFTMNPWMWNNRGKIKESVSIIPEILLVSLRGCENRLVVKNLCFRIRIIWTLILILPLISTETVAKELILSFLKSTCEIIINSPWFIGLFCDYIKYLGT